MPFESHCLKNNNVEIPPGEIETLSFSVQMKSRRAKFSLDKHFHGGV
jgi:hypothetical protein